MAAITTRFLAVVHRLLVFIKSAAAAMCSWLLTYQTGIFSSASSELDLNILPPLNQGKLCDQTSVDFPEMASKPNPVIIILFFFYIKTLKMLNFVTIDILYSLLHFIYKE